MGEDSCQAGLIGKYVDQSPADNDGVAHAKGFKWRGEQHASTYWTRQIDIIGDFQIVHDSLENVIDVAFGREQSSAGEALDNVVFGLLLPLPLSLLARLRLHGCSFLFLS